jgi:methylmalonyl-CoA mutase N-terminal domain/subunit
VELGERDIVGVNVHGDNEELGVETLYINEDVSERQIGKLNDLRRTRDANRVARSLAAVREVALGKTNLMPSLLEAVRAYATLGEICDALRDAWGEYEETPMI